MREHSSFLNARTLRQLTQYSSIGVVSFILDISTTNLLVWQHVSPRLAGFAGILVAFTNSFLWNRYWTFKGSTTTLRRQLSRSAITGAIGGTINALIYDFLLRKFSLPFNVAKLLAGGVVIVWNFSGMKFWAFEPKDQPPKTTE
ncbi:MAG: GtrA family protein [Patescibacteria group bacterium]